MDNRHKSATNPILLENQPNDIEAEKRVIGTILCYSESLVAARTLTEESFYHQNHKDIFRHIKKVADDGDKPDLISVSKSIRLEFDEKKASQIMLDMAQCEGMSDDVKFHQSIDVLEHYRRQRVFREMGAFFYYNSGSMLPADLDVKMKDFVDKLQSANPTKTSNKDSVLGEILEIVAQNSNGTRESRRTYTGFRIFDEEGGFCTKKLILVGAGSSQGKTAFALSVVRQAMIAGQKVAIYSMEMDRTSVGIRLLNEEGLCLRESAVMNDKLLSSGPVISEIAERIKSYKGDFFIDDSSKTSVEKIIESIRNLKIKHNIIGAVVDYVQILNVYSKSRDNAEKVLADCARLFQQAAKDYDVWIMLLSQISRNPQAPTHDPSSDRLRGSGQLYEACDMNILIYRPEVFGESFPEPFSDVLTKNTALLKLCKNRGGQSHKAEVVHFYGDRQLFAPFGNDERIPRSFIPQQSQAQNPNTPF